jgi:hypothetical protein
MKVLILDIDGVINIDRTFGSGIKKWEKWNFLNPDKPFFNQAGIFDRADDFDSEAVRIINEILTETGGEIVISSDWKKQYSLTDLGDYFLSQGIIKKPIAVTPLFLGCDIPDDFEWVYKERYEQERSLEINQHVKDHPEITHWVAVDDLNMGFNGRYGVSNFVHTVKIGEGITETGIKEKIINYLK